MLAAGTTRGTGRHHYQSAALRPGTLPASSRTQPAQLVLLRSDAVGGGGSSSSSTGRRGNIDAHHMRLLLCLDEASRLRSRWGQLLTCLLTGLCSRAITSKLTLNLLPVLQPQPIIAGCGGGEAAMCSRHASQLAYKPVRAQTCSQLPSRLGGMRACTLQLPVPLPCSSEQGSDTAAKQLTCPRGKMQSVSW